MNSTTERTMSDTLRAIAELIDAHPDLPLPYVIIHGHRAHEADLAWNLHIFADDGADQKSQATAIIQALGGKWDKDFDWDDDINRADFKQTRDGFDMRVTVHRDAVCERVVVGEEVVTVKAVEAVPERTETREVVEWRCAPLLAAEATR